MSQPRFEPLTYGSNVLTKNACTTTKDTRFIALLKFYSIRIHLSTLEIYLFNVELINQFMWKNHEFSKGLMFFRMLYFASD